METGTSLGHLSSSPEIFPVIVALRKIYYISLSNCWPTELGDDVNFDIYIENQILYWFNSMAMSSSIALYSAKFAYG